MSYDASDQRLTLGSSRALLPIASWNSASLKRSRTINCGLPQLSRNQIPQVGPAAVHVTPQQFQAEPWSKSRWNRYANRHTVPLFLRFQSQEFLVQRPELPRASISPHGDRRRPCPSTTKVYANYGLALALRYIPWPSRAPNPQRLAALRIHHQLGRYSTCRSRNLALSLLSPRASSRSSRITFRVCASSPIKRVSLADGCPLVPRLNLALGIACTWTPALGAIRY